MKYQSYEAYLNSPEWRDKRQKTLRIQGFKCRACGARNRLQVHHSSYKGGWGNEKDHHLVVLCDPDHEGVTAYIAAHKAEAPMYQLTWRYIFTRRRELSTAYQQFDPLVSRTVL